MGTMSNEGEGVYIVGDNGFVRIPDDVAQKQYKKYGRVFIAGDEIKASYIRRPKKKQPINWDPDLKVTIDY